MTEISATPLSPELRSALSQITDLYLPEGDFKEGFIYPNAQSIRDKAFLYDFVQRLQDQAKKKGEHYEEFVVRVDEHSYRGHKIETVSGLFYALRRMPQTVPTLDNLGLDQSLRKVLMSERLNKGGLIIICGETGQGKSTTCAATIKERMFQLGSFCLTVEDPPEMPLHGIHGNGRCLQTEVRSGDFAEAMRGAMRCYPTVNGSILYVGETRDSETATEVLRIAMNGNLVFTTLHANSVQAGLRRLSTLAASRLSGDANEILGQVFRVGLHQVLEPMRVPPGQPPKKKLSVNFLLSHSHQTPVANKIRKGEFEALGTDQQQQKAIMSQQGHKALLNQWED